MVRLVRFAASIRVRLVSVADVSCSDEMMEAGGVRFGYVWKVKKSEKTARQRYHSGLTEHREIRSVRGAS